MIMKFPNNKYILYNKYFPLLSFRCERDSRGTPIFIREQQYNDVRLFHFDDIDTWIKNRRAPVSRTHIKRLMEKCGCNDLEGFIRFSYCTSLNDTLWVKPEGLELSWDDISLYRNRFDENIARLAFGMNPTGEDFTSTTPELTTDGSFAKCWKRFRNEIFLLKQGSSGTVNSGLESYSELYTYELSRLICDDPLPYYMIRFHNKIASRCKIFTSEDIGFAPAISFFNQKFTLDEMIEFFDDIGSGNEFRQMIVLDALTLNTDRHLKNFGVLYDNDTMEIIKMAPVFDNNLALCPYARINDLKNIDSYMTTRQCSIGDGFIKSAIKCLTPDIKDKLHQIRSFEFNRQSRFSLPEERLVLLENMIHQQAEDILHEKKISF